MVDGINEKVPHHLSGLRVLNMDMLLLAHGLHEILMYQFPDLPPRLAIIHNQKVIALGYQSGYDGSRPVAVDVTFLVEEIFDEFAVGDDERGVCESFETKDTTEFLRPLRQSDSEDFSRQAESSQGLRERCGDLQKMGISRRNLMFVAQDGHSGWT